MKRSDKRIHKSVLFSIFLLCIAAVLLFAAKNIQGFAEWYSINIYSMITATIGRLAGTAPFSVAEAAVCILPLIILADIIFMMTAIARKCMPNLRK